MKKHACVLIALTLTGVLLSGCTSAPTDSSNDTASGAEAPIEPAPDTSATPGDGTDGFPTCGEVKAVLGPVVGGLIEIEESDNGVSTGSDGPSLGCAWFTPETTGQRYDLGEYGGISIGVFRDPEFTEESTEPLGWNVDDPRVSAADAWALKVGGNYNAADQLDATGVQVVRDGIVVVLTSGGVVLQDVPQLASLTNEWALGAGVKILDLME